MAWKRSSYYKSTKLFLSPKCSVFFTSGPIDLCSVVPCIWWDTMGFFYISNCRNLKSLLCCSCSMCSCLVWLLYWIRKYAFLVKVNWLLVLLCDNDRNFSYKWDAINYHGAKRELVSAFTIFFKPVLLNLFSSGIPFRIFARVSARHCYVKTAPVNCSSVTVTELMACAYVLLHCK